MSDPGVRLRRKTQRCGVDALDVLTGDEGLLVPFAIRNGTLVHISSVSSGDRSGYCCPKCHERVVPALGPQRRHHFRHHVDIDCRGAFETALHLAAKEIVSRHQALMVPDVVVTWEDRSTVVSRAQYVSFSTVRTEAGLGAIRPDIWLTRPNKPTPLLVEVYVTHKVDADKKARLSKMGYPCIEVDVSSALTPESYDPALLERILVHSDDPAHKRWLCIPNEQDYVRQLQEEARREREEEERKRSEVQQAKQRRLAASLAEQRRRQERLDRARALRAKTHPDRPHPLTDIPVPHETAFNCLRAHWQEIVLRQFVERPLFKADNSHAAIVEVASVEQVIHRYHGDIVHQGLARELDGHNVAEAVVEYLDELEKRGIVRALHRPARLGHLSVYEVLRTR